MFRCRHRAHASQGLAILGAQQWRLQSHGFADSLEQQVSAAQQPLRLRHAQEHRRFQSLAGLQADAEGKIGFDHALDDFAARSLRGQHQMDSGRAGLLAQPRHQALQYFAPLAIAEHQVGVFIADANHPGHRRLDPPQRIGE